MFWNLIRRVKKNNSEDLYAIKNKNGEKLFNEKDIKQYTELYYKELYLKKNVINIPQVLDWIHWKGNRKITWKQKTWKRQNEWSHQGERSKTSNKIT